MITKDQMIDAIRSLPDDATLRDAIERLEFIAWIQERIADADAHPDDVLTQDDVERLAAQWRT